MSRHECPLPSPSILPGRWTRFVNSRAYYTDCEPKQASERGVYKTENAIVPWHAEMCIGHFMYVETLPSVFGPEHNETWAYTVTRGGRQVYRTVYRCGPRDVQSKRSNIGAWMHARRGQDTLEQEYRDMAMQVMRELEL